ncbi:MAG: porin, partial [Burkholderiales bacterium]
LSAWFQCESSADIRGQNQDGWCSRNSAVGFKGGFGNVYIGRWDTPYKRAHVGDTTGAEDTGLFGTAFVLAGSSTGTEGGASRHIWKRRQSSMISYDSPSLNGFQVSAGYSTANSATAATTATTSAKPRVVSLAAIYKNGPLAIGAGYERHNEFGATGGSTDDRGWVLSATYTFGNVKVGGVYTEQRYDVTSTTDAKKKAWGLGVDWKISGPHGLAANYTRADDISGTATSAINTATVPAPGASTGAKLYQIAYTHAFSKRTSGKFGYVKLDNDTNARYALGGTSVAAAGNNQSAWVMLLKHNF